MKPPVRKEGRISPAANKLAGPHHTPFFCLGPSSISSPEASKTTFCFSRTPPNTGRYKKKGGSYDPQFNPTTMPDGGVLCATIGNTMKKTRRRSAQQPGSPSPPLPSHRETRREPWMAYLDFLFSVSST